LGRPRPPLWWLLRLAVERRGSPAEPRLTSLRAGPAAAGGQAAAGAEVGAGREDRLAAARPGSMAGARQRRVEAVLRAWPPAQAVAEAVQELVPLEGRAVLEVAVW
jgi:hypothetical protein